MSQKVPHAPNSEKVKMALSLELSALKSRKKISTFYYGSVYFVSVNIKLTYKISIIST